MTPPARTDAVQPPVGLLLLITGCLMLQPLSTDLYLASLPHLAAYFSASPAVVQQTLSFFVIGFALAQLISGPLSDRFGRRPVLIGGIAVYVAGSLACAVAPTMATLVVARLVQAAGCCTAAVIARAVVRDAYPPAEGAHVIAKASSLFSVAPLLGPIAGGYLQVAYGWRAAFFVLSSLGLLLGLFVLLRFAETNQRPDPNATRIRGLLASYAAVLRAPAFWAYTLPGALSYGSIFVFISGAPFVLIKVLGVPTQYFGYCFAFGVLGYLGGTLYCRRLLRRIGIERTLGIGSTLSLLTAAGFLLAILGGLHHWATLLISQFLVMFAHGINFPCAQTGAVSPFPERAGTAAGWLGCLTMLTAFAVGTVVGATHDGSLYPLPLISATVGVLLFASARLLARHRFAAAAT